MESEDGAISSEVKIESEPREEREERVFQTLDTGTDYPMTHGRRGHALILNFEEFHPKLGQSSREGSEVDAEDLCNTFSSLGFDVDRRDNLKEKEVWSVLLKYGRQTDHSDCDCFVLCYLSHGEDERLYTSDSRFRTEELVLDFMPDACPTLAGKPKLFFVQACRGRKYDRGVLVTQDDGDDVTDAKQQVTRKIPVMADFLWAFSVAPGHYSWRNNVDGSWFIQALCAVLRKYSDQQSVSELMLHVSRLVAEEFESDTDQRATSGMKQVPCVVSTLTRRLLLKPPQ